VHDSCATGRKTLLEVIDFRKVEMVDLVGIEPPRVLLRPKFVRC